VKLAPWLFNCIPPRRPFRLQSEYDDIEEEVEREEELESNELQVEALSKAVESSDSISVVEKLLLLIALSKFV